MYQAFVFAFVLSACAAHVPYQALDQPALNQWFVENEIAVQQLQVESRPGAKGDPIWPQALHFQIRTPSDQERWRLSFRERLSAWFTEQGHPEGQCVSVDLEPVGALSKVKVLIVCR